jgi:small subunit ribosomal protein S6
MNTYEMMLVLPGKATTAKLKSAKEKIGEIISTIKGKIIKIQEWGKKDLAYKIKGNASGNFVLYNIELNPEGVKALREKLKMEEEIIRYLVIKK